MNPVYFPFTYLSASSAELLAVSFPNLTVYAPSGRALPSAMQEWTDKEWLDVRTSENIDEDAIERLIGDFRQWADSHQGSELAFFKTLKENTPFFDETSAQQIRTDIKRQLSGKSKQSAADPLMNARLFLAMAQEYDIRHWEFEGSLDAYRNMEAELLHELRDGVDMPHVGLGGVRSFLTREDPGSRMTAERLDAWARIAALDALPSPLYITTSRAAFEQVLDAAGEEIGTYQLDLLPGPGVDESIAVEWQKLFQEYLEQLLNDPASLPEETALGDAVGKDWEAKVRWTCFRMSGNLPEDLFKCCCRKNAPQAEKKMGQVLIGLIEGII